MRKIYFILMTLYLAMFMIVACKIKKQPDKEVCTFGIDSVEYEINRTVSSVARKKPQPVPPINPDNPDLWPVLFVDFDGDTVKGTTWNWTPEIICEPSGLDSTGIRIVMDNVIEDYGPWKVRVTNVQSVFDAAHISKRQKVILTISTPFGLSGGQAMRNSFGSGNPAFVFTALLVTIKKAKEATSHELGHTLGLFHQDKCDSQYGAGMIMGNGYYVDKPWWHDSPCQKDMSVIDKKLVRR